MSLIEKLERRAKQLDPWYGVSAGWEGCVGYDLAVADARELLEQAAARIRELEEGDGYIGDPLQAMQEMSGVHSVMLGVNNV